MPLFVGRIESVTMPSMRLDKVINGLSHAGDGESSYLTTNMHAGGRPIIWSLAPQSRCPLYPQSLGRLEDMFKDAGAIAEPDKRCQARYGSGWASLLQVSWGGGREEGSTRASCGCVQDPGKETKGPLPPLSQSRTHAMGWCN
jgi:hypothetical protein